MKARQEVQDHRLRLLGKPLYVDCSKEGNSRQPGSADKNILIDESDKFDNKS
jgi:hypothetical protein